MSFAALELFIKITSLASDFLAHRKADKAATEQEFFEYLSTAHQDQLVQLIQETSGIAAGTKAMLSETREDLAQKIDALTRAFVELASTTRAFAPLANALVPGAMLSDQALSILRGVSESGSATLSVLRNGFDSGLTLLAKGNLPVMSQQFIEDDLAELVRLGLLRPSSVTKGCRIFNFTRRADALVRSIG